MDSFNIPSDTPLGQHGGTVYLSDLKPGEKGRIIEIGGAEQFRLRLIEMGLTRGTEICVDKYAPLRDPVELILRGYHLSIRGTDAQKIMVERIN